VGAENSLVLSETTASSVSEALSLISSDQTESPKILVVDDDHAVTLKWAVSNTFPSVERTPEAQRFPRRRVCWPFSIFAAHAVYRE
jgi:hypothetical protein